MASAPASTTAPAPPKEFDPEEYRMTIGEHLEELRRRVVLGMLGLILAVVFCLIFGEKVIVAFCSPLISSLQARDINAQVYYTQISDPFMTYLKISLISAVTLASPWIIYQLWLFVAAGLYPHERRAATRFVPWSILLLVLGMLFVYFVVLPLTIGVLIDFGSDIPLPARSVGKTVKVEPAQVWTVPELKGDPEKPVERQLWLNSVDNKLKMFLGGKVRVIPFGPEKLAAPMITLPNYIDLVVLTMLMFGIAFQLPLVVLALVKIGVVEVPFLRSARRYVYFAMSILAAILSPGDVVASMLALLVPLIFLYEFGILLAVWSQRKAAKKEAESAA